MRLASCVKMRKGKIGGKMVSDAQKRASVNYNEKHTKQIKLKLNLETDADILEKLESELNMQGYIKSLI